MKKILFKISTLVLLTLLNGCIDDPDMPSGVIGAGEPEFDGTTKIEAVTATSIRVTATISQENGYKVIERGFFYGTFSPPNEKVIDTGMEKRTGSYTLTIDGLNNNTPYYILPYAINSMEKTGQGKDILVTTNEGVAIIETFIAEDLIRATSAGVGVKITFAGEGEFEKIGICYYEQGHSEQKDTIVFQTTYPFKASDGETFTCPLTGLKPDTRYYVQAFTENTYGPSHGELESLLTLDGKPVIGKTDIKNRGFTEVTLTSSVTNGGDETVLIVERGFCWAIATETDNPDISNNVGPCDGAGEGPFEGTIKGLISDTPYYARAYAKSNLGIIGYGDSIPVETITDIPTVRTEEVAYIQYGNAVVKGFIVDIGELPVTASGICWSHNNSTPTTGDFILPLIAGTDSVFSDQLTGLRGGTTYYVRAYATNAKGTGYGVVRTFTTPPVFTEGLQTFKGDLRLDNSLAYFAIGGGDLYILGGDLGPSNTSELWRYSIASDSWAQLKSFTGGPAKWQFGIRYGNGALVYGGFNGSGAETSDIYYYNAGSNEWEFYPGPDSAVVVYSTVGYPHNSSVYYIGGKSGDSIRQDVWSFNYPDKTWQRRTDFPVNQYGGIALITNNIAYVGLGNDASGVCNKSLWSTSDDAFTWNHVSSYSMITGSVLGGVVCNDRLYIIDESYYILEFNPVTLEWTRKSLLPSNRQNFHCIFSENDKIYIGLGDAANSLMVYDPLWDNELY